VGLEKMVMDFHVRDQMIDEQNLRKIHSFIQSVFCLTTDPKPPPK